MAIELKDHPRTFLPADFTVTNWDKLQPYFEQLLAENPASVAALEVWMQKVDELLNVVSEDFGWRYIKMTCNTSDEALMKSYQQFVEEISPKLQAYSHKLTKKYHENPHKADLDTDKFFVYNRIVDADLELFREENIPLNSQCELLAQQYNGIIGSMSVEIDGQEYTIQQANKFLQRPDRAKRQQVWERVQARRANDAEKIDGIFDELVKLRTEMANNAGFYSYTDYKYKDLGRFDYTRDDVANFRKAIANVVRPVNEKVNAKRQALLGYDSLRPWDLAVDPEGKPALAPFEGANQLVDKTVTALTKLRPELGSMIAKMNEMQHLDLDSRKGKAPGGYNYPLMETGVPFIFMNAVGLQRDLTTMVHEAGHAIHSFVTRDMTYSFHKDVPSEIAELASMAMELISMDHWDVFYDDEATLKRAKREQLEHAMGGLTWIATIDAFQTWIYDHPTHTQAERRAAWVDIYDTYMPHNIDWSGYEHYKANQWHRQLHLFEVPFYYIEYGIAQLGALQVWRNYRQDPAAGLDSYLNALKMGYTRPIGEVYASGDIAFDFSEKMISELFDFVSKEYEALV